MSGVFGVQPKVLLEATQRGKLASADYIVNTGGTDYPQLAANEYFCMTTAKRAGLQVAEFHSLAGTKKWWPRKMIERSR
jgi:serine/threonine-protein kinase HipA